MNKKFNRKIGALVLASVIPLTVNAEVINTNDKVITTTEVNCRLNATADSYKLGTFEKGTELTRLYTDDDWSLIDYYGNLAFVKSEYLESTNEIVQSVNIYQDNHDIVYTTSKLRFREGPGTNTKELKMLDKGEELTVLSETENGWYLVIHDGKLGYVSKEFTWSVKEKLKEENKDIKDVKIRRISYSKSSIPVYSSPNDPFSCFDTITEFQEIKELGRKDGFSQILLNGKIGYVETATLEKLSGTFITADIKGQLLTIYCNTDIIMRTDVVTGKDVKPTPTGLFEIEKIIPNKKLSGYNEKGEWYEHECEWALPIKRIQGKRTNNDSGIYIHTANWRTKFGGKIYHNNGSLGCINVEKARMRELKEKVKQKTKVLIYNKQIY